MAFDKAVCICTGLLKPHRTNTGLVRCYRELSKEVAASTVVQLYRWGDYERIMDDLEDWGPSEIVFVGHSYGSSSLAFVAAKMQEIWPSVRIGDFLSTDGVYRDTIERIDKDSLDDDHEIELANNVDRLYTWRQGEGPITGHKFKIELPTILVADTWVEDYRHAIMDRFPGFLKLVKELALA